MRLIDADALKQAIDAYANESVKQNDRRWDTRCTAIILDTKGIIDDAPTIGGWISVKDRLPETNDEVLTTYVYDDKPGKRYVETANYWDDGEGEGHWNSVWDEYRVGKVRQTVIAWMPMPKPYKPPKEET